jgi:hypothetical protein
MWRAISTRPYPEDLPDAIARVLASHLSLIQEFHELSFLHEVHEKRKFALSRNWPKAGGSLRTSTPPRLM